MITKPAEVLLVQRLMGNEAAAVHRTAFVARKGGYSLLFAEYKTFISATGNDMCGDTNSHWARAYFNRNIAPHMQVRSSHPTHFTVLLHKSRRG